LRKGKAIFTRPPDRAAQLEMLWPEERLGSPPSVLRPEGFNLRTYRSGDEESFFRLLSGAGMSCPLDYWMLHVVPEGFFFIEHEESGLLVATCMAAHHPKDRHSFGGNLGWLACHSDYQGRGLGYTISAAVTRRLIEAGYRRIFLETDDFRLPAIKIYLKLGWVPLLFQEDMPARWQAVCKQLGWKFCPERWASTSDSA
jgi:mycothiol synthase